MLLADGNRSLKWIASKYFKLWRMYKSMLQIRRIRVSYNSFLRPLWPYGFQILEGAKPSQTGTILAFQSNFSSCHNQCTSVCFKTFSALYWPQYKNYSSIANSTSTNISRLSTVNLPDIPTRRLNRKWCRDLFQ